MRITGKRKIPPRNGEVYAEFRRSLQLLDVGECLEVDHADMMDRKAPPTTGVHAMAGRHGIQVTYRRLRDDAGRYNGYRVWRLK